MCRSTFVLVLAGSIYLAAAKSDFLTGLQDKFHETAPYTVIKDAETYQLREYAPANWVCTHIIKKQPRPKDMMKMFWSLFQYITDENSQNLEMNMTSPVSFFHETYEETMMRCQLCFYLPADYQEDPPEPTQDDVYIENRPMHTLAARMFDGYMLGMAEFEQHKLALQADLKLAGDEEGIDFSQFYGAVYDPPMKMKNRRNEVWFVVNK
ncbi:heme-binding protein 2-like [Homarus americanus]|uniref:heme-binding protein 2-like n=1 Tax=Homarus americanus TaxID=6706 RepID=UPI001C4477BA|nr:heme-binding protein 2-like [Homarus americanus]